MRKHILVATTTVALLALVPRQAAGQGSKGQPITPAKIAFRDVPTDEIRSDGLGPYVHSFVADGLAVFIGSQAGEGNFYVRPNTSGRKVSLTLPANPCGLPSGINDFDFRFLVVEVNNAVSGGAFGMLPGDFVHTSMRSLILYGGSTFMLHFSPGDPGVCKDQSGKVRVDHAADSWTVSDAGFACVEKNLPKGKSDFCFSGPMNFSFKLEKLP